MGCSRLVSMPTNCAPTEDCISARTPLPKSVALSRASMPKLNTRDSTNTRSLLPATGAPATLTGSVMKS